MDASGSTRRNCCPEYPLLSHAVHLHRGVSARVVDLTGMDLPDRHSELPELYSALKMYSALQNNSPQVVDVGSGGGGAIMRLEAATADWRADDDHLRRQDRHCTGGTIHFSACLLLLGSETNSTSLQQG